ncbi:DNA glycosylase AlkZ-like family protein [Nonomuraea cypriaca]|uniref:DNA glycosylase AlkZ-like family protein n=1 Tax=Nonomuraea cypriaca TaxID=1187855 RepID=UPI001A9C7190|nr:crosslink repair DNA glycosylase YcaQ family protein [Nonomuraea cypriaca]
MPPRDPYIQVPDREGLVPDRSLHRRIWRSIGEPGTVLADGRLAGTWRQRKQGRKLLVTVEPFTKIGSADHDRVEAEVRAIAALRGAADSRLTLA